MHPEIKKIWEKLEGLQNIDAEDKVEIFQGLLQLEKSLERNNFKLKRTLKDKSIMANVLNATITGFGKKQTRYRTSQ